MNTNKIKEIARLRDRVGVARGKVSEADKELGATPEYFKLEAENLELAQAQSELINAEQGYRKVCIETYNGTAEKVYPGGKIRLVKTFDYDEADAVNWAIEHKTHSVLKIAKGDFKNAVCRTPLCPDFVKKITTPKLYLDGDLSQYVNEEK